MISDLHIGAESRTDLLRREDLRARLLDAVRDADRLVILGDGLELREAPHRDATEVARDLFGEHRVRLHPRLDDAIEQAVTLAETGGSLGESIGSGGVIVTGSVVTVGEARHLLRRPGSRA